MYFAFSLEKKIYYAFGQLHLPFIYIYFWLQDYIYIYIFLNQGIAHSFPKIVFFLEN